MTHQPIAITGMHRSGTSVLTRGLHDSGLHLLGEGADELLPEAEDNPEGFWENKAIVACNDDLLEATGGAWDDPPDLPPQGADDPRVVGVVEGARAALAGLGRHEHWGFKDPRTCLTAAFWLDLEPDLRFVVCVRHPLEVALSLRRRNQNSYALGLSLWERYYRNVLALVPADRRIVTHYDALFADPDGELARVCAFAGLRPAAMRMRDDLRHHTAEVSLVDAGVGEDVRRLYAALCEEAGHVPPPEPPPDEARVRRLVLDGAVARRHADQRQAAIERLQEREAELRRERDAREAELRREKAASEAELRARIRTLEGQLQALGSLGSVREAVARTEATVAAIDRRTRHIETTVVTAAHWSTAGLARRAVRRLPPPVQHQLRRASRATPERVVRRADVVTRRVRATAAPRARAAVRRLPPPVQHQLRRASRATPERVVRRAEVAARRLPPPARAALRRPGAKLRRLLGSAPHRPPAPPAKGPSPKLWFAAYERLVAEAVPGSAPWLVVTPGSPGRVGRVGSSTATAFPSGDGASVADLSHIAVLEARRYEGNRYLVVPEGSRSWFAHHAALRDHVVRTYDTVVDRQGAGAVHDLWARPAVGARSLRAEVTRVAGVLGEEPAVLDWTTGGVGGELPGVTTFRPPVDGDLPYADASVDVVVVEEPRSVEEARRVATSCVIAVDSRGPGAVRVVDVDTRVERRAPTEPRCLVWSSDPDDDPRWRALLEERVADAGAELCLAPLGHAGPAGGDHDVVVCLEPYVVPLPASLEAAASLAAADPEVVVAGKVIAADGRLEAAGGTVFSDRSAALIGLGSADVRAPWHEYSRPVCWAPGILAAAAALWERVELPGHRTGRDLLREWCGAVWEAGGRVRYQPLVSAVRVTGDGREPAAPMASSVWQRVVDLRPNRPRDLSDGAWRHLLASDDVEAHLS